MADEAKVSKIFRRPDDTRVRAFTSLRDSRRMRENPRAIEVNRLYLVIRIDNPRRSGLIRQRIPMSTAPLVCQVCKKSKSPNSGMIAELIRPSLLEFIKKKVPDLDSKAFICFEDLGEFRKDYVKEVLEDEIGKLSALDQEVIKAWNSMKFFRATSLNSSKGNSHLVSDSPTGSPSSAAAGNF